MKISIITPSMNSEKFIEDNLKSVHLQQNNERFDIEQIIVDGSSTDATLDIIKKFKEENGANIRIIQGKDKNMYDAINKGLREIDGDVWACLNTDDLYYPGIFDIVADEFEKNSCPDVVYGYPDMVDENGEYLHTFYLPEFDLDFLILRGYCLSILQPASFLKKDVLDKVGYFNIDYKYAADYDYFIRVGYNCKMKLVKKSFTKYRQHSASITCNENTSSVQHKESRSISKRYVDELNIKNKSLLVSNIKLYIAQIKPGNLNYALKRIKELTTTNSWGWFIKERLK